MGKENVSAVLSGPDQPGDSNRTEVPSMAWPDCQLTEAKMEKEFGSEYASIVDASFIVKYRASRAGVGPR